MPNPLTRKLELFGELPAEDRRLLDAVATGRRSVPAKTNIIQEGDAPTDVHLVLSGFACRSKVLANGRRQIFAYLVQATFAICTFSS
ncbi:cyclic nucleotide-binding domain-containing protein [Bradyrhizobium japonicum]|uniref:cyclic nucleotide-binding domain-containing protein n=1 Tax=Bradyrhizobium japonicum TaxID=375 RepID=UPI003399CFF3